MKIGIISAVPDEIKTIHQAIPFANSVKRGNRDYYIGQWNDLDLVLVYSGVGKVSAAMTATTLIDYFNVDKIIFTGLAGAVADTLSRGDIVLGNKTYQHDFDARPLSAKPFEIPFTGQQLLHLNTDEVHLAERAIKRFLQQLATYVDINELDRLSVNKPTLHIGTIASGDLFISDVHTQQNLFAEGMDTLAVEMEGAAVAQVCDDYNMPYILIRIISDKANDEALASLEEFSEKLASHYACGIVQEILKLH